MKRPSIHEVLLHMAYAVAARGTCPSIQVGCVIARDGRVLTSGYNGAPAGMEHCTHPAHISTGDGDVKAVPCTTAIHAESNAIAFAARYGTPLHDAVCYSTLTPCRTCAQMLIQAGITAVYAGEAYRDASGTKLLYEAGITTTIMGA